MDGELAITVGTKSHAHRMPSLRVDTVAPIATWAATTCWRAASTPTTTAVSTPGTIAREHNSALRRPTSSLLPGAA
jgi:hypothetical protein